MRNKLKTPAPLIAALVLLACSSPPPPKIPPREVIGPPREAAIECRPPTTAFAQSTFRIADLDRGKSCTAFLEQDECILAIFLDCTFDPPPSRSWRGSIGADRRIRLDATYDSPAVGARAARDCSGALQLPTGEPGWSKLACRIPAGADQRPHGGFYLERADSSLPPPFSRDGSTEIVVATPASMIDDFVSDFVVLPTTQRIWALVNAGQNDPATGLYIGALRGPRLEKDPLPLTAPAVIRATDDETIVLVADGPNLYRIDAATRALTPMTLANRITDVAIRGATVLVASSDPPNRTRLSIHALDSLATIGSSEIGGAVTSIVPLMTPDSGPLALLTFDTTQLVVLSAALTTSKAISLELIPRGAAMISGTVVGFSASGSPGRYFEVDYATGRMLFDLTVPDGGELRSLIYDPEHDQAIVGSRTGLLTVLDRAGQRPLLGSQIQLPARAAVNRLRWDKSAMTAYALLGTPGSIYRLLRRPAR